MTTISFSSPLVLDRYNYENLVDFLLSIYHMRNSESELDFHELDSVDVSKELQQKIKDSKKKPVESFTSLSDV